MASVDTSIHPHASGAAAEFAARHSAPHDLRLYGGWFCPFVQRAWIVLHEKSIPHQYIEVNPYQKGAELLALNPRGLVPTLRVPPARGGTEPRALYESLVVCEYLDEAYGGNDEDGRLLPAAEADPFERARCRLWIDHVSSRIVPAFYKLLQHTPEKTYSINEARDALLDHIQDFARAMAPVEEGGGPWFLGARFSLVDVALAPWAARLFLIDHYKPGGLERESVRDTLSERIRYVEVYKRYAEDKTQSLVGKATREGARLP
ncbi:unnamed protein product [Parascedosporium putredinis]|uniref:Glutathione S-transferase n=1 Tax=Parascedosporium putredinis TaxID=1442378 RepID=A0A9P1H0V0_9PEZI|nr:unnamed protein product [Parascedosporium putredinis]CAI7992193.1 unnamed protein product [Parascedosporium putredinis]